jgi:polygalacturonase
LKRLIAAVLLFASVQAQSQTYNITSFGATTDSGILNTKAIQSAIDQCNNKGGGEVIVPAGTFYTGTVFLKSNVYLHLMPGAVLQGSYNPADYPEHTILSAKKFGTITHDGLFVKTMKALIFADNVYNTGIKGEGTLKGAGEGQAFQLGLNKDGKPKNIFFIGCTNVLLKEITVLNAAQVTISVSGCDRVNVDGIYVSSLVNWNCDGMDVDAKNVTISNCIIDSEDDALCFKSEYLGKFCENITVTNCVLSSLCNGIKLGTGSRTGFRNITVSNCVIKKSPLNGYRHWNMPPDIVHNPGVQSVNTGIVILGVDGGLVENISFSNIIMTDVLSPFFIRVGKRFLNPEGKPSVMRNISISHVRAECRSVIPSVISGLEESPAENVTLTDITIYIPISVGADSLKNFPVSVLENNNVYPENRLTFGTKLPSSAFYIKHVNGITLNNVSVNYREKDARPAICLDDAKGVRFKSVLIGQAILRNKPAMLIQINHSELLEVPE